MLPLLFFYAFSNQLIAPVELDKQINGIPNITFTVNRMVDVEFEVRDVQAIILNIPYENTSIIIHEQTGWRVEVHLNQNASKKITFGSTYKPYVIDFGENTGFIKVYILDPDFPFLHISGVVYSQLKFANMCEGRRYVSIGSYHQFTIAGEDSSYSRKRNISTFYNQKICIWFASPVYLYNYFKYDIGGYEGNMYLVGASMNTTNYDKKISGSGSCQYFTTNSSIMYWTYHSQDLSKSIVIESKPEGNSNNDIMKNCGFGVLSYESSKKFWLYDSYTPENPSSSHYYLFWIALGLIVITVLSVFWVFCIKNKKENDRLSFISSTPLCTNQEVSIAESQSQIYSNINIPIEKSSCFNTIALWKSSI